MPLSRPRDILVKLLIIAGTLFQIAANLLQIAAYLFQIAANPLQTAVNLLWTTANLLWIGGNLLQIFAGQPMIPNACCTKSYRQRAKEAAPKTCHSYPSHSKDASTSSGMK